MTPTPVTIITGFLGSGKTTLILNLIPQLPKTYRLALLKNEFGDLAVDSQLASSASISGVRELLNGCICCNLVGQLGPALLELRSTASPDRIVIETSGSAFPATLAMEVNRLVREHPGSFVLDGVISVIDVENWTGYSDTSITAKMQASFTDLIVFNKWELVHESRFDECLDRVGDLELQTAWVKSQRGWVDQGVVMGIDGSLIGKEGAEVAAEINGEVHGHGGHGHHHQHQEEVEVLSVVLESEALGSAAVDMDSFEELLLSAPKDEVYRIKGLLMSSKPPSDSTGDRRASTVQVAALYVLNWAFGRWTYTALPDSESAAMKGATARLTFILARGEATKWKKKLESSDLLVLEGKTTGSKLSVEKKREADLEGLEKWTLQNTLERKLPNYPSPTAYRPYQQFACTARQYVDGIPAATFVVGNKVREEWEDSMFSGLKDPEWRQRKRLYAEDKLSDNRRPGRS